MPLPGSSKPERRYAALVLAGSREPNDPLAVAMGVPCRALLDIRGQPMVERVLDKQQANYCEYFAPSPEAGGRAGPSPEEAFRNAAEKLFE